jgi:hypothetical protein
MANPVLDSSAIVYFKHVSDSVAIVYYGHDIDSLEIVNTVNSVLDKKIDWTILGYISPYVIFTLTVYIAWRREKIKEKIRIIELWQSIETMSRQIIKLTGDFKDKLKLDNLQFKNYQPESINFNKRVIDVRGVTELPVADLQKVFVSKRKYVNESLIDKYYLMFQNLRTIEVINADYTKKIDFIIERIESFQIERQEIRRELNIALQRTKDENDLRTLNILADSWNQKDFFNNQIEVVDHHIKIILLSNNLIDIRNSNSMLDLAISSIIPNESPVHNSVKEFYTGLLAPLRADYEVVGSMIEFYQTQSYQIDFIISGFEQSIITIDDGLKAFDKRENPFVSAGKF